MSEGPKGDYERQKEESEQINKAEIGEYFKRLSPDYHSGEASKGQANEEGVSSILFFGALFLVIGIIVSLEKPANRGGASSPPATKEQLAAPVNRTEQIPLLIEAPRPGRSIINSSVRLDKNFRYNRANEGREPAIENPDPRRELARAVLRQRAERNHPRSLSVQDRLVTEGLASYDELERMLGRTDLADIPRTALSGLQENAAEDHPNDFSKQLYQINRNISAYRESRGLDVSDIPRSVVAQIISDVAEEYPFDYSTQLYFIKRELNRYRSPN